MFFLWQIATAIAGAVLGINPFDQPDVEASKIKTRELTTAFEQTGALPREIPACSEGDFALYTDAANAKALRKTGADAPLESWLKAHFARIGRATMWRFWPISTYGGAQLRLLAGHAARHPRRRRVATCLEFGPRFLHSTGQAYKGGPDSGVFLQITSG